MSWHLIEKILDEVSKQSTFVGKVWVTLLFVFRIIAVTRIGDTVYADEQAAFKCNTRQPGCENVCFNKFSPISHMRFWGFQIIIVATPAMIFMVYAAHAVSKLPGPCKLSGRRIDAGVMKKRRRRDPGVLRRKSNFGASNQLNETILSTSRFSKPSTNLSKVIHPPMYPCGVRRRTDNPPTYESRNSYPSHHLSTPSAPTVEITRSEPFKPNVNHHDVIQAPTQVNKGNHPNTSVMFEHVQLQNVRRYSDGDLVFKTKQSPTHSVTSQRENSRGRQYAVAEECYIDDVLEPSFVWELDDKKKIAVTLMHLRPKSECDSAFSENTFSFGRSSPRRQPNAGKTWGNTATPALIKLPQSFVESSFDGAGRAAQSQVAENLESPSQFFSQSNIRSSNTPRKRLISSCIASRNVRSANGSCTGSRQRSCLWRTERKIAIAYFVQCVLRMLLEIAFLVLQYKYFSFKVPELYKCVQWPCPNMVDCFISRPQEKSTMLIFMFGVTALCIVLTCFELIKLIGRRYYSVKNMMKTPKRDMIGEDGKRSSKRTTLHKLFDSSHPDHCNNLFRQSSDDVDRSSSSDSSSSNSSSSDASALAEASFNSEELSDMLDEAVEVVEYNDQAEANEFV
ncbi:uncharacterized protein LOC100181149 [Ciona intestinalis]